MKVWISSRPRPLTRSRLAGSVGSGRADGSKPLPSSRTTNTASTRDIRPATYTRRPAPGHPRGRSPPPVAPRLHLPTLGRQPVIALLVRLAHRRVDLQVAV